MKAMGAEAADVAYVNAGDYSGCLMETNNMQKAWRSNSAHRRI